MNFNQAALHVITRPSTDVTIYGDFAACHFFARMHAYVAVNENFTCFHSLTDSFDFARVSIYSYVRCFKIVFLDFKKVAEL